MTLDRLTRVVPPPSTRQPDLDWGPVEDAVGKTLPADYKALVATYGAGAWDGFLHVFQPSHPNEYVDLATHAKRRAAVYAELAEQGEDFPAPLADLMAVAQTDNGDAVFWHCSPAGEPERWPILVNEARGPEWVRYPGSLTEFLADVLTGAFRCPVFPDGFPTAQPRFHPYE